MMHFLPRTIAFVTAISPLFVSQMDAYCARCIKIEEERAKEQTAHPQTFHYYDDLIGLHENNSSQSENSTQTETGVLSGSTYRITEVQKSSESSDSSKTNRLQSLLLANTERPIDENFFEEDDIPNPKGKDSDKNDVQEEGEKPTPVKPVESSLSKTYSAIYTIFKTKNFLEALGGSYTLFIPTNQAILALPPEKIMNLVRPENAEKLATLVSNHVIARKILRKDFIENNNEEIKAISGRNLTLSYKDDNLYVENIRILRAEPAGSDGIIYLIEKVLDE